MDKEQDRLIRLSDAIEAMKKLADAKEMSEIGRGYSFFAGGLRGAAGGGRG